MFIRDYLKRLRNLKKKMIYFITGNNICQKYISRKIIQEGKKRYNMNNILAKGKRYKFTIPFSEFTNQLIEERNKEFEELEEETIPKNTYTVFQSSGTSSDSEIASSVEEISGFEVSGC